MTKVIAIHTVLLTIKAGKRATKELPAVKPVTQTIQPGTVFVIDDPAQLAELKAAGAVREPEPDETHSVPIAESTPAPAVAPVGGSAVQPPAPPAPPAGADKSIDDMSTHKELDAALEAAKREAPEGWADMKVAEKKAFLKTPVEKPADDDTSGLV